MITWATTVDPQTFSTQQSAWDLIGAPLIGDQSVTLQREGGATTEQNWSRTAHSYSERTERNGGFLGEQEGESVTVLGTTNSTNTPSTTIKSVLNVTSTETVREYTYKQTGSTTSAFTYHITTAIDSETFTMSTSSTAQTMTTTNVGTLVESCIATTQVSDETICTPILATVVVAEKDEVIWIVDSIAATDINGFTAASSLGSTATRTTIMPWTQTVSLLQRDSTETEELSLPLISQSVNYVRQQYILSATTTVVRTEEQTLPHVSSTTFGPTYIAFEEAISHTVFSAQNVTARGLSTSETLFASSYTTIQITSNAVEVPATTTVTATFTREATAQYAESFQRSSNPIYSATSGSGSVSYTWAGTFLTTVVNDITTFSRIPQAATVMLPVQASAVARSRDYYEGVYANGTVAGGYTCNTPIVAFDLSFPEVKRGVSSILPKTGFTYGSTYALFDSDIGTYPELTELGKMTVNGLSITLKESESSANSVSFTLEPFGQGRLQFNAPVQLESAINGKGLGQFETIYQTLAAGVYSQLIDVTTITPRTFSSTSFSTSGGCASWALTDSKTSQALPVAVSFIAPTTVRNGASPIWWTVSRNSHSALATLTNSLAYEVA